MDYSWLITISHRYILVYCFRILSFFRLIWLLMLSIVRVRKYRIIRKYWELLFWHLIGRRKLYRILLNRRWSVLLLILLSSVGNKQDVCWLIIVIVKVDLFVSLLATLWLGMNYILVVGLSGVCLKLWSFWIRGSRMLSSSLIFLLC